MKKTAYPFVLCLGAISCSTSAADEAGLLESQVIQYVPRTWLGHFAVNPSGQVLTHHLNKKMYIWPAAATFYNSARTRVDYKHGNALLFVGPDGKFRIYDSGPGRGEYAGAIYTVESGGSVSDSMFVDLGNWHNSYVAVRTMPTADDGYIAMQAWDEELVRLSPSGERIMAGGTFHSDHTIPGRMGTIATNSLGQTIVVPWWYDSSVVRIYNGSLNIVQEFTLAPLLDTMLIVAATGCGAKGDLFYVYLIASAPGDSFRTHRMIEVFKADGQRYFVQGTGTDAAATGEVYFGNDKLYLLRWDTKQGERVFTELDLP